MVDDKLSCACPVEVYYYHESRPKKLVPKRDDWPVICYHCGSSDSAAVDQGMVASDKYAMVLPLCPACKAKGKKTKTTNPAKTGGKKCSAPSGKKRTAEEAELIHAERQARKKPTPERNAGEDVVEAVVGKMKQGNKKFIYWSKQGGGAYGKNTCTWERIVEEVNPALLVGHAVRFRLGQTELHGKIAKHESGSKYFVEFESRRHSDRVVDLELPKLVSAGEYSWWRLDGYDTCEDEGSMEESDGQSNEGSESDESDE